MNITDENDGRTNELAHFAHAAVALHDNPGDDDLVHHVQHARMNPERGFLSC